MGIKIAPNPMVKDKTLSKQVLSLRARTSWTWAKMAREFHRVMGYEGPSHTTLFRYATKKVKRPNVMAERYVRQAIEKINAELNQKQNRIVSNPGPPMSGGGNFDEERPTPLLPPH